MTAQQLPKLRIALAIILLAIILSLPPATEYGSYLSILGHTAMTLKGQAPHADVAQDFYGIRALVTNQDPYARLRPALKTMGVEWKAGFSSTHPPTAFLVVAPVAFLPWPLSSMAWAWLMLIGLCISIRIACGFSWDQAILITVLALLWPPIATSFDQITILWLFGLAMAFHFRNDRPFLAGIFVGIASFTKLLPIVVLFPFIIRRKWEALLGFGLSWLAAVGVLVLLSPKALLRYLTSNRTNAIEIITRWDNGSFLFFLSRRAGTIGLLITAAVVLLLLFLAIRKHVQEQDKEISAAEWNIYAFMTVLLLPITWIFSIAPFLPNLLLLLKERHWLIRAITLLAFIPPMVMPPWGTKSTIGLFGFFILAALALVLAQVELGRSRQPLKPPNL